MIYITGDTHRDITRFRNLKSMYDITLNPEDYIIICGDFGFIYCDNEFERKLLDELENFPYTVLWVDGNHENFNVLNDNERYSVEEWNGGKVHRIRKNVLHLMRGQVFVVEGKKIFTMGGAYSIDRAIGGENISYWEAELPSKEECEEARRNLAANDNKVDIIITHTAPKKIITEKFYCDPHEKEVVFLEFLESVMNKCEFKEWYFGHWHEDRTFEVTINEKKKIFNAMLDDVLKIEV